MGNAPLRDVPANGKILEATSLLEKGGAVVHLALASVLLGLGAFFGGAWLEELRQWASASGFECGDAHGDRFKALDVLTTGSKEAALSFELREETRLALGEGLSSKLESGLAKGQKLVLVQASSVCREGVLLEGAAHLLVHANVEGLKAA